MLLPGAIVVVTYIGRSLDIGFLVDGVPGAEQALQDNLHVSLICPVVVESHTVGENWCLINFTHSILQ